MLSKFVKDCKKIQDNSQRLQNANKIARKVFFFNPLKLFVKNIFKKK